MRLFPDIYAHVQKDTQASNDAMENALLCMSAPCTRTDTGAWIIHKDPPIIISALYECSLCSSQQAMCAHVLAIMLHECLEADPMTPHVPNDASKIPPQYIVSLHGKPHALYIGLLLAARDRGLQSLAATWTYNDADLSLAHAVATFMDGRRYEESGDATPTNVHPRIVPHFRRMALTRAKARALRDALGIREASAEELHDEQQESTIPHVPNMVEGAAIAIPQYDGKPRALKLVPAQTAAGKTILRVLSDDFPAKFTTGKFPGIPIWDTGLKASGLDLTLDDVDNLPNINGWLVEWREYDDTHGNKRQVVDKLIRTADASTSRHAEPDDDDDVPF